jgi:hypothetical protein
MDNNYMYGGMALSVLSLSAATVYIVKNAYDYERKSLRGEKDWEENT